MNQKQDEKQDQATEPKYVGNYVAEQLLEGRMATHVKHVAAIAKQLGCELEENNKGWINRFKITSETDPTKKYVIAQRRTDGVWGCGCMGWRTHRTCKHLNRFTQMLGDLMAAETAFGENSAPERKAIVADVASIFAGITLQLQPYTVT